MVQNGVSYAMSTHHPHQPLADRIDLITAPTVIENAGAISEQIVESLDHLFICRL